MKASAATSGSSRKKSLPRCKFTPATASLISVRAAAILRLNWPRPSVPLAKFMRWTSTKIWSTSLPNERRTRRDQISKQFSPNPTIPLLPKTGVDLVFTSNTYHHIDNRVSYFAKLRKYLRPVGRVAVIDFDRRAWIEGLLRHYTPSEFIKREMEQAGYALQQDFDSLDHQSF